MKNKNILLLVIFISLLFLTGCSKNYKIKDIGFKVNENWKCKKSNEYHESLFCPIVENKVVLSAYISENTWDNDSVYIPSVDSYIDVMTHADPEMNYSGGTGIEYNVKSKNKIKVDKCKGKNVIYYEKVKNDELDVPIIHNSYIFQNKKHDIYVIEYYTYDNKENLYGKYTQEFKDIINSIKCE